jgi:hypothetical protein
MTTSPILLVGSMPPAMPLKISFPTCNYERAGTPLNVMCMTRGQDARQQNT